MGKWRSFDLFTFVLRGFGVGVGKGIGGGWGNQRSRGLVGGNETKCVYSV